MGNLYIMIGVPGSGKDRYIGTHQQDGDVVCSSDGIREELGDVNDQTKNKLVFQMLYERVEKALSEGKNVWFNATNVTVDNRSRAISLGKKYNAKIIGVVMATPTERCISNEDLRDRKVGREVIQKFARRFENPSIEEGFSEIKIIVNGVEVEAD